MRLVCAVAVLGWSAGLQFPSVPALARHGGRAAALRSSLSSSSEHYLSSLPTITLPETLPAVESVETADETRFAHAPASYFTLDKLMPKGPRKNADVGEPHDATRPLATVGAISAGSWWCAQGGWPSPTPRATTEVFFVFAGHGCLTDLDGTSHYFGPGDTVVLPKGWSGRWDIMQPIHKVWFVHDHPNVEETASPIRAVITHYGAFAPHHLAQQGVRPDAIHGAPRTASRTIYDVGPTEVGCWTCSAGSFPVVDRSTTECFHVLEGVFVLSNTDGSARRCVAGDTVILPRGWTGHWDVIEPVRKLWVVID